MANIYARNDIFVTAASPIIIQTRPGESLNVANDYKDYELSHRISTLAGKSAIIRSISRQFPRISTLSQTATGIDVLNSTPFTVMGAFDYVTGVWSGPDVEHIAQDNRVLSIWRDNVNKHILSYPYASPDYTYNVRVTPAETMYFTSMQEVRHLVGADVANSQGYTGKGVNAVVVDTGGHKDNPMTARLIKQTAITGLYTDENGHGEWCASALGGKKAEDLTFTELNRDKKPVVNEGIAPDCNLYEVKALDLLVGTGTDSWLLRGLSKALSDKADVVSCSWGGTPDTNTPETDVYYTPMKKLKESNAIVCVASGDSGPSRATIDSPGSLPNVLTVGALNAVTNTFSSQFGKAGEVSGFSSRGPAYGTLIKPDVVSYGAIIDSAISPILSFSYTHINHAYQAIAGTSQATPVVAGLISLMKQAYGDIGKTLDMNEVMRMLSRMGHAKNNNDGYGLLTWDMISRWMDSEYKYRV